LMVSVALSQNPNPADVVFDENGNGFINVNNTGWQVLPTQPDPNGFGAIGLHHLAKFSAV